MVTTRLATAADYPTLATVLAEMQAHYAVPCPVPEAILAGLRDRPAGSDILLAVEHGTISGFAAVAAIYPGPGLQPGFFLKELYVTASARSSGSGKALMRGLARLALERGFKRIDWTAARDDLGLRGFYEALGAAPHPEKIFYRLTGDALLRLGSEAEA
ncbi:GCN5-related N-acetyltransferase [Bosea sp. LC85]|uniref:GNAT family N-acetyltransferase n=1 Tax=Bosea sp. LC85 TaxID=1502851 RepID=UPI0004E2E03B|nr:GNAT family N-acetyltransferase [Bosea sp. LC85]KFC63937.1 GCN5-related N-acetyltransferase [Bosea sp. LC85]